MQSATTKLEVVVKIAHFRAFDSTIARASENALHRGGQGSPGAGLRKSRILVRCQSTRLEI